MKNITFLNTKINGLYALPFVLLCFMIFFQSQHDVQHMFPVVASLYVVFKCCRLDIVAEDEIYRFSLIALALLCVLMSIGYVISHSNRELEQTEILLHLTLVFFTLSVPLIVFKFLERIARK